MLQLVCSLIFHYILPYSTCNFYIKWLAVCEGQTRWKMIHKDIMFPHPKDISFFFHHLLQLLSRNVVFLFNSIKHFNIAVCEIKNCSYLERLSFILCFHFKHATLYKWLLANILLQNITTYGLQIMNCTSVTKTVGTVEIKYCSRNRKNFKAVYVARAED